MALEKKSSPAKAVKKVAAKKPVAGAEVFWVSGTARHKAVTDAQGHFRLDRLPPRRRRLRRGGVLRHQASGLSTRCAHAGGIRLQLGFSELRHPTVRRRERGLPASDCDAGGGGVPTCGRPLRRRGDLRRHEPGLSSGHSLARGQRLSAVRCSLRRDRGLRRHPNGLSG